MICPNENMEKNYTKFIRPYLEELEPLLPISTGVDVQIAPFKTKAVVFDIYGTLIISASGDLDKAEYNAQMIKKALLGAHFEIVMDTEEAFNDIFKDFNAYLFGHLSKTRREGKPFPEVDVISVWHDTLVAAEKKGKILILPNSDIYLFTFIFELQTNKIWPMPEMKEVINTLHSKGIILGIVSNAQFYTPVIMNYLLHNETKDSSDIYPFAKELSVFSYRELRGKPDTYLFEKLVPGLMAYDLKPEEVLYVGNDMLKDVYTSSRVGFKTVLYAGDKRSYRLHKNDKRVLGLQPDFVITKLSQLLDILELN